MLSKNGKIHLTMNRVLSSLTRSTRALTASSAAARALLLSSPHVTTNDRRQSHRRAAAAAGTIGVVGLLTTALLVDTWRRRYGSDNVAHCASTATADASSSSSSSPPNAGDADFEDYWAKRAGARRDDLPTFTIKQLAEHTTVAARIWVSYKSGVYDITEWVRGVCCCCV